MHHVHTGCLSWSSLLTVASRQQIHFKLTHNYNTRANYKRRMEITDNENRELKAQVAEAQDAQIQAQAQATEMRNQMLTAQKVEISYHPREPVVICPPGPMPYTSDKAVPYRYAATIIENGKEVEIKTLASVTNITANSRMTRSGHVFAPPVTPSRNVEKDPVVVVPVTREAEGQTTGSAMSPAKDGKEDLISLSRSNTEVSIPQRVKKVDIQKLQGISCCSLSIQ
ncbi:hypothetical protein KIW84_013678 [Lathyrus oleraceus]|uniref:Uncharacterized protein n=1 Tax=Pisum sativum TaxID=3888 RepID=A0A9D5BL29_PEA|nr:hypothetical protein KIW84_013678 [Pisum sativum]